MYINNFKSHLEQHLFNISSKLSIDLVCDCVSYVISDSSLSTLLLIEHYPGSQGRFWPSLRDRKNPQGTESRPRPSLGNGEGLCIHGLLLSLMTSGNVRGTIQSWYTIILNDI